MSPEATPVPTRNAAPAAASSPATRSTSVGASIAWTSWRPGSSGRIAGTTQSAAGALERRASRRPTTPMMMAAPSVASDGSSRPSSATPMKASHAAPPSAAACATEPPRGRRGGSRTRRRPRRRRARRRRSPNRSVRRSRSMRKTSNRIATASPSRVPPATPAASRRASASRADPEIIDWSMRSRKPETSAYPGRNRRRLPVRTRPPVIGTPSFTITATSRADAAAPKTRRKNGGSVERSSTLSAGLHDQRDEHRRRRHRGDCRRRRWWRPRPTRPGRRTR